jgi:hypothetical protein
MTPSEMSAAGTLWLFCSSLTVGLVVPVATWFAVRLRAIGVRYRTDAHALAAALERDIAAAHARHGRAVVSSLKIMR